ncbi:hypothetical protein ACFVVU_09005 [Kitasatospora sp. NPDC057965]|uniref:hypothetical protein n=1 Tax=Kitasatospora sp. NPDC057965 TaxID=3346291 RepID=UPI0036D90CC9
MHTTEGAGTGWFWDSPEIEVEGVVADHVVYDVAFDEYNRVFIDPDHGNIEVYVDGAVVDRYIYPASTPPTSTATAGSRSTLTASTDHVRSLGEGGFGGVGAEDAQRGRLITYT